MAEAKTKPTKQSVKGFIANLPDPEMRADCSTIVKLMETATGSKPLMWGASIVGFGTRKIKYSGGQEVDWPLIAFSPRKQKLTLYVMAGEGSHADLLEKLGKHSVSKGCLYIKRLSDVDVPTLKKLINASVKRKKR
jgi:hypothetical protein